MAPIRSLLGDTLINAILDKYFDFSTVNHLGGVISGPVWNPLETYGHFTGFESRQSSRGSFGRGLVAQRLGVLHQTDQRARQSGVERRGRRGGHRRWPPGRQFRAPAQRGRLRPVQQWRLWDGLRSLPGQTGLLAEWNELRLLQHDSRRRGVVHSRRRTMDSLGEKPRTHLGQPRNSSSQNRYRQLRPKYLHGSPVLGEDRRANHRVQQSHDAHHVGHDSHELPLGKQGVLDLRRHGPAAPGLYDGRSHAVESHPAPRNVERRRKPELLPRRRIHHDLCHRQRVWHFGQRNIPRVELGAIARHHRRANAHHPDFRGAFLYRLQRRLVSGDDHVRGQPVRRAIRPGRHGLCKIVRQCHSPQDVVLFR